jgi:hypothetical protein
MRARDRRRLARKIEGNEGVGGTGAAPCQSWREEIQSAERSSVLDLVGQVFWVRPCWYSGARLAISAQISRKRTGAGHLILLMTEIPQDRKGEFSLSGRQAMIGHDTSRMQLNPRQYHPV